MLKINYRSVGNFAELNRRMVKKRERILYRTGGYGLKVIRNSIKTSKKTTSRPGEIPKGKTRALKRHSRFEVDINRGDLHIGFTNFPSKSATPLSRPSVPATIQQGGLEKIKNPGRSITRPDGTVREVAPSVSIVNYAPRPITEPASPPVLAKMKEFVSTTPI